jgi:hypothetical protein
MNKKTLLFGLVLAVLFSSCMSVPTLSAPYQDPRLTASAGLGDAAVSSDSFHISRYFQSEAIPAGSSVGIISASGSLGTFLALSLEEKGLNVRNFDLYSLLPYGDIALTNPGTRFMYSDELSGDASEVVRTAAKDPSAEATESTEVDVDALIERLYNLDDLVLEAQRVDHYLALKGKLRQMIASMNLNYIIVVGSAYSEYDYQLSIYNATNFDLVFSHIIIADLEEWREVIGKPGQNENLSYKYADEREPLPFFELAYAEFVAGILEVE